VSPVSAILLFLALFGLALLPSASVTLVVTRSATRGLRNGLAASAGIVAGDLLFVSLSLTGMTLLAHSLGAFFSILKTLGGLYLIWLGISLLRASPASLGNVPDSRKTTLGTSFLAGVFLTLGDLKAILFYASLLPAFLDLNSLSPASVALVVVITVAAVGLAKVVYALAALRIVSAFRATKARKVGRTLSGGVLIGTGSYLATKG
jgi:threonine/homoserine/homoserine lactone efflux protein